MKKDKKEKLVVMFEYNGVDFDSSVDLCDSEESYVRVLDEVCSENDLIDFYEGVGVVRDIDLNVVIFESKELIRYFKDYDFFKNGYSEVIELIEKVMKSNCELRRWYYWKQ